MFVQEVATIMSIFSKYAETFKQEALKRNIRIRVLSTHKQKVHIHWMHAYVFMCFYMVYWRIGAYIYIYISPPSNT